jgi:hypothetical protein
MDPSRWDLLPVQFPMNFESSPKRTSETWRRRRAREIRHSESSVHGWAAFRDNPLWRHARPVQRWLVAQNWRRIAQKGADRLRREFMKALPNFALPSSFRMDGDARTIGGST